jgi:hypothetical protein
MYGGQSTHLPLRLNQAGVIPIIFAVSIVLLPSLIANYLTASKNNALHTIATNITLWLNPDGPFYNTLYFLLVVGFTFFYTAVIFNPKKIATEIQKYGGFIPGIRPGNPTSQYLNFILTRITLAGAVFLGLIAIFPAITKLFANVQTFVLGGTGILIVVSVVLETIKSIEAKLVMRSYDKRKSLDQISNLTAFSSELKQLIIKIQEEIKSKFHVAKEFDIWKRTEEKPDENKFFLETSYTFLNEILLLWVCRDKKLLTFEIIKDNEQLSLLKNEAQKIYSHIFSNNIFDWYIPENFLLQEITNLFNKYDFTLVDRDILGKLYEQFITREERKKLGQFYTPESVIDYILDQIEYTKNIDDKKIIDISCGSGGFTTRATNRLINKLKNNPNKKEIIEKVISSVYGMDINPFACYL